MANSRPVFPSISPNCPAAADTPVIWINGFVFTNTPFWNVCAPVHVGLIPCDSAGAASDRMYVVAVPLVALKPIVALGFAPLTLAEGMAQVPSPRQKVEAVALVPEFKFVTGRFPVTPPAPEAARLIAGKSAPTIARKPTAPLDPFGVARNWLAVWPVANVRANVPLEVSGEPVTVNTDGAVNPMDEMPPGIVAQVPSPRQNVVELAEVPELRLVTGKLPVTPPAPDAAKLIAGTSAPTSARSDGEPVVPLGVANTRLAARLPHHVNARVPVLVIGEPETQRGETTVADTLLTVPPPVPGGVAQVPSPRQKLVELAPVPLFRFAGGRLPVTQPEPAPSKRVCESHVPPSAHPG